jgi:hypothetical protein
VKSGPSYPKLSPEDQLGGIKAIRGDAGGGGIDEAKAKPPGDKDGPVGPGSLNSRSEYAPAFSRGNRLEKIKTDCLAEFDQHETPKVGEKQAPMAEVDAVTRHLLNQVNPDLAKGGEWAAR